MLSFFLSAPLQPLIYEAGKKSEIESRYERLSLFRLSTAPRQSENEVEISPKSETRQWVVFGRVFDRIIENEFESRESSLRAKIAKSREFDHLVVSEEFGDYFRKIIQRARVFAVLLSCCSPVGTND